MVLGENIMNNADVAVKPLPFEEEEAVAEESPVEEEEEAEPEEEEEEEAWWQLWFVDRQVVASMLGYGMISLSILMHGIMQLICPTMSSTSPIPAAAAAAADAVIHVLTRLKALTVTLSVLQVVFTVLPLVSLCLDMAGKGNKPLRVAALISLILLAAVSVTKLILTAEFWSTSDPRYAGGALLL